MNFDEMIDRQSTESVKWNWFEKDVLPMWVADMDFQGPPGVLQALRERVEHGIFGYGFPPKGLGEVISNRLATLYGWQAGTKEISYVPGIVTGFNLGLRAVCEPGDAVIFNTPAYPPFFKAPLSFALKSVENPLARDVDGQYQVDFERFEAQIRENKVKAFILCNPQNPTGRVFTRQELEQFAAICLRHQVTILSDEIHCDIIYDGRKHTPIASMDAETAKICMTFMAPSKTFNIAGLHASEVIIQDPELTKRFCAARRGIVEDPGLLALVAAKAAYETGGEWLAEVLTYLQANRDWLIAALAEKIPAVKVSKPEGTFLAWLDCSGLELKESPHQFFLREARVGLNEGADFGAEGKDHVRLNFGTPRANLETALARMSAALAKI